MRHAVQLALALALALAAGAASACRAPGTISRVPGERATVRVENRATLDMVIYAARSGQRVRLGTATALSTQVFEIPQSLLAGGLTPLQFIADPIGRTGRSITEEITVSPGDQVVLSIPPS